MQIAHWSKIDRARDRRREPARQRRVGEARAIEQALINRNPGFENIRNSISPNHSWYGQAVEWGESWLKANGF